MSSKRDLADALESVGLFSRCTPRERRTIARHVQTASFPTDTDLVIEGEPGDALFVILSGTAAVLRDGGEVAILDGAPRSATIRTKSDVKVAVLGIRMFRTLLREVPDLAEQLLVGLAGELRKAQAQASAH